MTRADRGFVGLRTAALIGLLVGAVGSVGLLLRATSRNPSLLLVVLLAIWVASPFVLLLLASIPAKRWSMLTRAALNGLMLVVALGSLAIYVADALWPRGAQGAFFFIIVPPVAWVSSAIVVSVAAIISRRRDAGETG